jgi:hypothetical protein
VEAHIIGICDCRGYWVAYYRSRKTKDVRREIRDNWDLPKVKLSIEVPINTVLIYLAVLTKQGKAEIEVYLCSPLLLSSNVAFLF